MEASETLTIKVPVSISVSVDPPSSDGVCPRATQVTFGAYVYECIYRRIDGWMDVQMDGWLDVWMDKWWMMDGWVDIQMDGWWMDG